MRIAWFTPRLSAGPHPIDDTPSLVAELGTRHRIELYDERRAHDFVWRHWRNPYDVCLYELADTPAAAFIWPYLLHYPGVVRLRSASLRRSRARMLNDRHRNDDYLAERVVAGPHALGVPLRASRIVCVGDAYVAQRLQDQYPEARIRCAPLLTTAPAAATPSVGQAPIFGVVEATGRDTAIRAAARARDAGTRLELHLDVSSVDALRECDVIVSLQWPPAPHPPLGASFALPAGRPAVVYESAVTSQWPALNPQTWQPRGFTPADPVVVAVDPRDAEHSLMLAMRRLAGDADLRAQVGGAAHAWWQTHAIPAHAADAWEAILTEASSVAAPSLPDHWAPHLTADGTERAREMLADFGVTVDFLAQP